MMAAANEGTHLWRAVVDVPGAAMPDVLDALDDVADSVSLNEIENPATGEAAAWRIELFFRARPDITAVAALLRPGIGDAVADLQLVPVPATDWILKANLQIEPIAVGRFFVHGEKDRAQLPPDAIGIEIEAGMAFGSGEHATTRACLQALDQLARRQRFRRVLDLGCGSGILAIAAMKAWPSRAAAADVDVVAVRVALENARKNGVARFVRGVVSDGYAHPTIRRGAPYDLVLANILALPLIELAPQLARHLAPGGHAVLSGLFERHAEDVVAAHRRQGLRLVDRIDIGPWVGLILRRPNRRSRPSITRS